jgi:colanic acid/amylovoran biosynthesis glycosyltransferase
MKHKKRKIAIYSGDIPSTTFIERLIVGLSNSGCHIYLFGFIKTKASYTKNVTVFGYKNTKIYKALHLLKYSVLLFVFKYQEKSKLDTILKFKSQNKMIYKVKYYPVLWHKPDVFHIQWAKGLNDWMWVKQFGIKLVLSLRGAHINYSPVADLNLAAMYRENFPEVDMFHAVSKAIAEEANKYGAHRESIKVVYSGLDLYKNPVISQIKSDQFQIISVGRPHWKKGYHYALDALKIAKSEGLNFKYIIIGGANDIELAYQVEDLKLQEHVILLGQLPINVVVDYVKDSNVLLLPSVEEGIANVVLEALSLKTLVLTTDCGGMSEVITDGYNGFIVPIRDTKAIANKLIYIKNLSLEKGEEIRANGLKTVKLQHSEKQLVNHMMQLYKDLF